METIATVTSAISLIFMFASLITVFMMVGADRNGDDTLRLVKTNQIFVGIALLAAISTMFLDIVLGDNFGVIIDTLLIVVIVANFYMSEMRKQILLQRP